MDLRALLLDSIARRQTSLSEICAEAGIVEKPARKRMLSALNRLKREKLVELVRYPNGRAFPNGNSPHLRLVSSPKPPPQVPLRLHEVAGLAAPAKVAPRTAKPTKSKVAARREAETEAARRIARNLQGWTPIEQIRSPDIKGSRLRAVVKKGVQIGLLVCVNQMGRSRSAGPGVMVNRAGASFGEADLDQYLEESFVSRPVRMRSLLQALNSQPQAVAASRIPWHRWDIPPSVATKLIEVGLQATPPFFNGAINGKPTIFPQPGLIIVFSEIGADSDRLTGYLSDLLRLLRAPPAWRSIREWTATVGLSKARVSKALSFGMDRVGIVKCLDLRTGSEPIGSAPDSEAIAFSVSLGVHPQFEPSDLQPDPTHEMVGLATIATSELIEQLSSPASIDDLVEAMGLPRHEIIRSLSEYALDGELACAACPGDTTSPVRFVWSGAEGTWDADAERYASQAIDNERALEFSPQHRSMREAKRKRPGESFERLLKALDALEVPMTAPDLAKHLGRTREWLYQQLSLATEANVLCVPGMDGGAVRYLSAKRASDLGADPSTLSGTRAQLTELVKTRSMDIEGIVREIGRPELVTRIAIGQLQDRGQLVVEEHVVRKPVLAGDLVAYCREWRSDKSIRSRFGIQSKETFDKIVGDQRLLKEAAVSGVRFWISADLAAVAGLPSASQLADLVLAGSTRTAARFRELIVFCQEWKTSKEIETKFGRTIKLRALHLARQGLLEMRKTGRKNGGNEYRSQRPESVAMLG